MILNINDVSLLKNELNERFGIYLHMHDACGSQSFSFDSAVGSEVKEYLSGYIKRLGGEAIFCGDDTGFIIR